MTAADVGSSSDPVMGTEAAGEVEKEDAFKVAFAELRKW